LMALHNVLIYWMFLHNSWLQAAVACSPRLSTWFETRDWESS
jgi:hypothetical protein